VKDLLGAVAKSKLYDLAQPYFVGMPHFPTHPPFLYSLTKKHGDFVTESGMSSAADAIALGTHVGTHIDALSHFSCGGKLHQGIDVKCRQSDAGGIQEYSVDTLEPIFRRGVLLDIAAQAGHDALPTGFSITAEHLAAAAAAHKVHIEKGDVVLLRTGWARYWNDAARYITGGQGAAASGPGPELDGARWLSERGIFAAGSDTIAFERVPAPEMPVHVHLLVENGIHIIEALNLEELSRLRIYEFLFVASPLKIRGATGSPIRPVALA
jgi:kynurenine formamidase